MARKARRKGRKSRKHHKGGSSAKSKISSAIKLLQTAKKHC